MFSSRWVFLAVVFTLGNAAFAGRDHQHHQHHHFSQDDNHLSGSHDHHAHSHTKALHPLITALTERLAATLRTLLSPLHSPPVEKAALTASLLTSSITLISLPLLPLTPHLHHLLPFAAGALLSDLTTHVLPQTLSSPQLPLLLSVLSFALLDAILRRTRPIHATAAINLAADALHNFCDGLSLAAAFLVSPAAGVSATAAIILHELPQEIADYALLLRSGFTPFSALLANFLCACTALLGTAFALSLGKGIAGDFVMPFAAGGLMYLTFSSIIPDVVADIAAPILVDGKPLPVPVWVFVRRILLAAVMACCGVAVIAIVEAAHSH